VSRGSDSLCLEFSTRLVTLRVQVGAALRTHPLENLAGVSVAVHNSEHNDLHALLYIASLHASACLCV
jgi:hypothetical protein